MNRFPALDGFRGLAILAVLANHLGLYRAPDAWWLYPLHWFSKIGWTGVDLFFVLSGFLITGILLKTKTSPSYFKDFYLRRVLRIFPLFYLLLVITMVVVPLTVPEQWPALWVGTRGNWPHWLFLSNVGVLMTSSFRISFIPALAPLWSLSVEEQFYLAWPLIVRFVSLTVLIRIIVLVFVGTAVTRWVFLTDPVWGQMIYNGGIVVFMPCRLDGLCAGSLLRIFYDTDPARVRAFARSWWIWLLALAAVMAIDRFFWPAYYHVYGPAMLRFGYSFMALLFASLVAQGLTIDGLTRRIFESPIRWLGPLSFSMYLFHLPIAAALIWVFPAAQSLDALSLFAVDLVLVIAFAAATLPMENYFRSLGRRPTSALLTAPGSTTEPTLPATTASAERRQ